MGHRGADLVGDEGAFDERAALVARGAETALFARKRAEKLMIAVGAVEAGEAGVVVAAVEEGGDGGGSLRVKGGQFRRVIVEHLPDGRGVGLAGDIARTDHLGSRSRWLSRRDGQWSALPEIMGKVVRDLRRFGTFQKAPFLA